MGDHLQTYNEQFRPTQPPVLSGMGTKYQPKCGNVVWLESKSGCDSLHLWINHVYGRLNYDPSLTCAIAKPLEINTIHKVHYRLHFYTLYGLYQLQCYALQGFLNSFG